MDRVETSPASRRLAHLASVGATYGVWGSVGIFVRHLDLPATAISGWRLGLGVVATWVMGRARPGTLVVVRDYLAG